MSQDPANYQIAGSHYTDLPVQPWDVIAGWPADQQIGFFRGNVLKYLMRMGTKPNAPALEDARKAEHYLHQLIKTLETQA